MKMWSVRLQGGGKPCSLSIPGNRPSYHDGRWSIHNWLLSDVDRGHMESSLLHYGIDSFWHSQEKEPCLGMDSGCQCIICQNRRVEVPDVG